MAFRPRSKAAASYLRSRLSDSKLIIEVEDDGVGMGAANLLEKPTGLGGTGIGMANVAERLKVLYGDTARMTIDSHEGKGTLIRLRMPVLRSEGLDSGRASTKSVPACAGKTLHTAGMILEEQNRDCATVRLALPISRRRLSSPSNSMA